MNDLQSVGVRYMTSKCDSLYSYENNHKYYGYKGEAIASILCASAKLIITTRSKDEGTYSKIFENGAFINTISVKPRSSKGTTVTVLGFFFNCPVKQKRINSSVDLNNIKIVLKTLAIIHPTVSFSLRDDSTGRILLNCFKTSTVSKSLCMLYEDIASEDLIEVKVSKDNIYVSGLIYTKSCKNSKPQFIYVNKRSARIERIQKYVEETLSKTLKDIMPINSYPIFIINISCPYSLVDILFDSFNFLVEFKSWDVVMKCIEKIVKLFIDRYKKLITQDEEDNTTENNEWQEIHTDRENTGSYVKPKQNMEEAKLFQENDNKVNNKRENGNRKKNNQKNDSREKNNQNRFKKGSYITSILQNKSYKNSLSLKKQKLKLKKKDNIFEKSLPISDLSLNIQNFSSTLWKTKFQKNPNYVKNIFDVEFNSQNLLFDKTKVMAYTRNIKDAEFKRSQNIALPNSFTNKDKFFNNEPSGKEFVMDLFLKSLTPKIQKNALQNEVIEEIELPIKLNSLSPSKCLTTDPYDVSSISHLFLYTH